MILAFAQVFFCFVLTHLSYIVISLIIKLLKFCRKLLSHQITVEVKMSRWKSKFSAELRNRASRNSLYVCFLFSATAIFALEAQPFSILFVHKTLDKYFCRPNSLALRFYLIDRNCTQLGMKEFWTKRFFWLQIVLPTLLQSDILNSRIISFGRTQPVGNFHADNGTNNNFCGPLVQRIRATSTHASTRTRFLLLLEHLLIIGLRNGARWLLLIAHSMWIDYLWGSSSGWALKRNKTTVVYTEWEDVFVIQFSYNYDLLYKHECFTGK